MKLKVSPFLDLDRAFPATSLFLADLEQMIALATRRGFVLNLSDQKHEYEGIEDLKVSRGQRVREIDIQISKPDKSYLSLRINIAQGAIKMHMYANDDSMLPLWHEVVALVQNRTRWYSKLMDPSAWAWLFLLMLIIMRGVENLQWAIKPYAVVTLAVFLMAVASALCLRIQPGLLLVREHEVQSVWDRYGEKTVLLIIGAMIGLVFKFAADKMFGK